MNMFLIVGESSPNHVRLKPIRKGELFEMDKDTARQMLECGLINIENPMKLYVRI